MLPKEPQDIPTCPAGGLHCCLQQCGSCSLSCQAWDHQNQQQEQMNGHDSIEELRAMKSQRKTQPMPCSVTSNSVYLASYSFWLFIWTTHAHAPFFKQPWTWNGWVWDCLYLQQCYAQHFGRTSHAGRLCKICQQWSRLSMMNLASLVSSRRSRKMLRMCSASTIFHRHKHSRTLVWRGYGWTKSFQKTGAPWSWTTWEDHIAVLEAYERVQQKPPHQDTLCIFVYYHSMIDFWTLFVVWSCLIKATYFHLLLNEILMQTRCKIAIASNSLAGARAGCDEARWNSANCVRTIALYGHFFGLYSVWKGSRWQGRGYKQEQSAALPPVFELLLVCFWCFWLWDVEANGPVYSGRCRTGICSSIKLLPRCRHTIGPGSISWSQGWANGGDLQQISRNDAVHRRWSDYCYAIEYCLYVRGVSSKRGDQFSKKWCVTK